MFSWLKTKRRERALATHAIPDEDWQRALHELPFLDHYDPTLITRLRELVTLFLVEKSITSGAEDGEHVLEVTPHMRIVIAIQACVLLLGKTGTVADVIEDYATFENVIVYPGDFPRTQDYEDEFGIVHKLDEPIAGESWEQGPVLLSWPAVEAGYDETGMALVIHEFAHKLDMLNGEIDGVPAMPREQVDAFRAALVEAYEDFCKRVDANEDTAIDPYAAEAIDEFFAVCCEVFFEEPELLCAEYAAFYDELARYFALDPVDGVLAR
ncbi:MAG: zinc-dependent peptidase [Casimicrobium sp.]